MKMVDLRTTLGEFDISFEPAAFAGYETMRERATIVELFGIPVRVAALADIVASKEAANRPKDQAALPVLNALADELAARERGEPPTG